MRVTEEEILPEWVVETMEHQHHTPCCCPICGAEIDPEGWTDCGCFNDIHYGKD